MTEERYIEIEKRLDSSVRLKLNQLRKFLDQGKASVMVGSGFSKNAVMDETVRMKDWSELVEDFYQGLYGSKPSDKDLRLMSALRLAQQVENTLGRTVLDEIIIDSLPNDSIAPGELHKLLVELKWRDIFTTNYDTLLEDATNLAFRHYNLVTSKDSLIYKPHPRIVKLHGSFPDNRPFIITEEDYRCYPQRFPEFVNTIRQALLETQFCLIGFSGDDPNFLNWIGWMRDIVGKQMLPIYMIYVGNKPHEAELQLLHGRKLEPILTKDIVEDNPTEAIEFILHYIGQKFKKKEQWSPRLSKFDNLRQDINAAEEVIEEMRGIRLSYPGWIIMPYTFLNEHVFRDCYYDFPWMKKSYGEIDDSLKLDFLYEYTWRLLNSFTPIWYETKWFVQAIKDILAEYGSLSSEDRRKADFLAIALLKIERITNAESFESLLLQLKDQIPAPQTGLHRRLTYEEALWALSHCRLDLLDNILKNWEVKADDYRGTLWKSKILIEIDRRREAQQLLEAAQADLRRKLMVNGESALHLSALTVTSNILLNCSRNYKKDDENTLRDFDFLEYYIMISNKLKEEENKAVTEEHGFNIGVVNTTWHMSSGGFTACFDAAAKYYLITEAYGKPIGSEGISYNSDINKMALPILARVCFDAAFLYLIESVDKNSLKQTLSRQAIFRFTKEEAVATYDFWIKSLDNLFEESDVPTFKGRETSIILPVLSRLAIWLDDERIMHIVHILWKIHRNFGEEIDTYLTTCFNSLSNEALTQLFIEGMECPISLDSHDNDIRVPDVEIKELNDTQNIVQNIIVGLESEKWQEKEAAIERYFYIYDKISKEEASKIDKIIKINFDTLKRSSELSILGIILKNEPNKIWRENLQMEKRRRMLNLLNGDFKYSRSSKPIQNFESELRVIANCVSLFSAEVIPGIIKVIIRFIDENIEPLKNSEDSDHPFLGPGHFYRRAMRIVNDFVVRANLEMNSPDLKLDLIERLWNLNSDYPLLNAVTKLFFMLKQEKSLQEISFNEANLKKRMQDGVFSSKEDRQSDSFRAVETAVRMSEGKFAVQDIVKDIINHITYVLDSVSLRIIRLLPLWITKGVIKKERFDQLVKVLADIPERVDANGNITIDLKSDILYGSGLLAKIILSMVNENDDDTLLKCKSNWEALINSDTIPRDIKNGFIRE